MMYLSKLLTPQLIRLNVVVIDKWTLLDRLSALVADQIQDHLPDMDRNVILEAVTKRERERTSAIGHGCALPHARIPGLQTPVACLATLASPLEFGAADGEPVRIVCFLLAPEEDPAITLKVMAEVATLMMSDEKRLTIETATDPQALCAFLSQLSTNSAQPLLASNIMRAPFFDIYPDTPLTEVTRLLQQYNLDAASVVERDGTLVGEITCNGLFRSGLPEFFVQLQSVAFIKNFDPFEKYFNDLTKARARDVMTTSFAALPEDATILEVIFELVVHRHAKVYVVREGKLVGIIDRVAVLDRVLNY